MNISEHAATILVVGFSFVACVLGWAPRVKAEMAFDILTRLDGVGQKAALVRGFFPSSSGNRTTESVALCVPHFLKNMCTMAYHVAQS